MSSVNRLALPPGTELRDFQIRETLGQGGFGITYRAINTALDQEVAVKEYMPGAFAIRDGNTLSVHPSGADSEDVFHWGLKRFLEEARILARLSHPNIVRVLYYMSLNETGYMVMEFLQGKTLGGWLCEREEPLTQQDILKILDPLTDALALVHDNGLAHRDIKPENIFMRDGDTPVLIDFGAARNVFTGRSQTVAAIVTPGYSPNEQYSGTGDLGPWTDIYALGAVVYRMICGLAPPDAPSRVAHDMEGRPDPCQPLLNVADLSFDADFLHAIDWALKLRANERPRNVREWRNALGLDSRKSGPSTAAGKPSNATEIYDWSSVARSDAPTLAAESGNDAPSRPLSRPLVRKRGRAVLAAAASMVVLLIGAAAGWQYLSREEDRIGNTVADAFPLGKLGTAPIPISDAIGGEDDRDIIRFDLDEETEVSFRWQAPVPDAGLRLFGRDGRQIPLFSADSGEIAELQAGDYALEISSEASLSQKYALELKSAPLDPGSRPGATPQTALALAGRGQMNGSDVLFEGRIWPRQRDHFFQLTLDKPSRVSVALEISDAAGSLSFTDLTGIAIASRDIRDGKADPLIARLPAGEHHVAVSMRGEKPWAYRLKVRIEEEKNIRSDGLPSLSPASEGESYETARLLPELTGANQSYDVTFTGQKTEHYMEARPSEAGILTVETDDVRFTEIELFRREDGDRIARAAQPEKLALRTNVDKGQYIIKISANDPSAQGKINLGLLPGSVAGATDGNPIKFGSLTARIIGDDGILDAAQAERWFSFSLDKPMRVIIEMTGPDDGPLPEGVTIAVHDRQRNHLESFHVEEHGEILTRAAALEAGGYLLHLTGADGLSTAYELRLFSLAELASKNRSESAGDPEVKGVATVSLREGMSRAEGLRLARAKARANAVNGTVIAAKAGAAAGDAPTGPAELLTALAHGIPYNENWRAQWLSETSLTVSMKSRLRKLSSDGSFTVTLGKTRFMTGERIPVGLASGQPQNIGIFALQADGTIGRVFPLGSGEFHRVNAGEVEDVTKDMGLTIASAPLPGENASQEGIIVIACGEEADFAGLAPVLAEAAQSSLIRAISTAAFLERLAGFCPSSLQVRVLGYQVENPGG